MLSDIPPAYSGHITTSAAILGDIMFRFGECGARIATIQDRAGRHEQLYQRMASSGGLFMSMGLRRSLLGQLFQTWGSPDAMEDVPGLWEGDFLLNPISCIGWSSEELARVGEVSSLPDDVANILVDLGTRALVTEGKPSKGVTSSDALDRVRQSATRLNSLLREIHTSSTRPPLNLDLDRVSSIAAGELRRPNNPVCALTFGEDKLSLIVALLNRPRYGQPPVLSRLIVDDELAVALKECDMSVTGLRARKADIRHDATAE